MGWRNVIVLRGIGESIQVF